MIEVLLYGDLKKVVKEHIPNADSILLCDYIKGEHFEDLLNRLGLKLNDVGTCYINKTMAKPENEIHDRDTVELNRP